MSEVGPLITRRNLAAAEARQLADAEITLGAAEVIDQWLAVALQRSGWRMEPTTFLLLAVCSAISSAAAMVAFGLPTWTHFVTPVTVGVAFFLALLWVTRSRMTKFAKQFPTALELMARATRAGESFVNSLRLAGRNSEEPLRSEFHHCVQQIGLGQAPDRAIEDLSTRIGSTEVELFAHCTMMHGLMGGQLAESLDRLSMIIRDRSEFAEKMKSTTGIARFAVAAVVVIGLFVFAYLRTVEPDYIGTLAASSLGHKLIAYALVSEIVGLVWVGWLLRTEF